jgi:uncharacterized protein YwgA
MNRYQLAKLVEWAGCLHTRKRLQKLVYMLQSAGCPLDAEFTLHHYGPYAQEVAALSDEMVRNELLVEVVGHNTRGQEYSYQLPESTKRQISDLERSAQGRKWAAQIGPFEPLAKELLKTDLKQLEYASTIAFFRRQGLGWPTAVEKACVFKNTQAVRSAEPLTHKVIP